MKRKLKLLLINAHQHLKHYGTQVGTVKLINKKAVIAPTALTIIAGLTPEKYDITIIDEALGKLNHFPDADLVGITTMTGTISRVYELCKGFKAKGIPVVLGGIHASMAPEEAMQHADAIVIGEAENQWHKVLEDFESGKLQRKYETHEIYEFKTTPESRWNLFKTDQYLTFSIQATRGCPYNCDFCGVTKIFGPKRRYRDIDDVIKQIKSLPSNKFIFADDNLTFNKKYARELVKALKPLKVSWNCQSSIEIANDEQLLKDMAEAGCEQILIGFESLNEDSLQETNKKQNLKKDYYEVVRNIQKHGIFVAASFVFGFDNDKEKHLNNIIQFAEEAPLPMGLITPLNCFPGSTLTERMAKEGRLLNIPIELKGSFYPTVQYKNFTPSEMFLFYSNALKQLFSYESVHRRAMKLFSDGSFAKVHSEFDVSLYAKIKTSFFLLKKFYFSRNKAKRTLFTDLFKLFLDKKLAMERLVFILIYSEGARSFLKEEMWNREDEHVKRIEEYCNIC